MRLIIMLTAGKPCKYCTRDYVPRLNIWQSGGQKQIVKNPNNNYRKNICARNAWDCKPLWTEGAKSNGVRKLKSFTENIKYFRQRRQRSRNLAKLQIRARGGDPPRACYDLGTKQMGFTAANRGQRHTRTTDEYLSSTQIRARGCDPPRRATTSELNICLLPALRKNIFSA